MNRWKTEDLGFSGVWEGGGWWFEWGLGVGGGVGEFGVLFLRW